MASTNLERAEETLSRCTRSARINKAIAEEEIAALQEELARTRDRMARAEAEVAERRHELEELHQQASQGSGGDGNIAGREARAGGCGNAAASADE